MKEKTKKVKIRSCSDLAVYYMQDLTVRMGRFKLEPAFACTLVLTLILCKILGDVTVSLYLLLLFMVAWTVIVYGLEQSQVTPTKWYDESWWWTLDGWQFEREVGMVFKRMGYRTEVTRGSGDGGVDIIMHKDGLKYIVQCKHYKRPLGPEAVRSLYGVKEVFNADRLVMVASSGVSPASEEFIRMYGDIYTAYDLQDIIRMSVEPIDKKRKLW